MGITVQDIAQTIERYFPRSLACDWDNPGLLCGRRDKEVKRILIALDATNQAVESAVLSQADLILTHHPLIFGSLKQVNSDTALGRKLMRLIANDISCYAMHTNFDIGQGGMGDIAAATLGLKPEAPLEITDEGGEKPLGIGFVGTLEGELSAPDLAELVKLKFELPAVSVYDAGKPVRKIAVCPGSGHGMLRFALDAVCGALITGDCSHHDGIDAQDAGLTLIDAGHYGIEHIFVRYMKLFAEKHFPGLEIILYTADPRRYI